MFLAAGQANAISIITLEPTPPTLIPGSELLVDISMSGLQTDNVDSLLGGWSLDLFYAPEVLSPLTDR